MNVKWSDWVTKKQPYVQIEECERLEPDDKDHHDVKPFIAPPTDEARTRALSVMIFVTAVITFSGIGFMLGHSINKMHKHSTEATPDFLAPPGAVKYPMHYNIAYSSPPSPETDKLWDDMFPSDKGFIRHPAISPSLSGLAVFHELHCVNVLRIGFYAAINGTLDTMAHMQHLDHNKRPDNHHLRHCFDYLRQSLLCLADTNLEPVDFALGGVTGWSFDRKCRNFDAVKRWAGQWGSWDHEALDGMSE